MALNKRKVLDSARKFAQKGAKAKALKEYQLLLQADPRDAKLLLEVGDCYRRWGQNEDAIAQYAKVAQQYRQDGFDARAVAVYKQILNLDPKHYAAYVSLSELYQRMGLDSEAIGALQTAADGYHREGRKADALELLRQMAALDPTNVTSRLKVAELLRQEKMTAEALAEYEAAARELENQQDRDQLIAVRERILELKPDHLGALTGMVRSLMTAAQPGRAEPFGLRALQASAEPAQYELLLELYAQMGNDAKLAETTRSLAKLYRDRGDDDKARELMQRLPADEVGARSRLAVDVSEVDEPEIDDEELLDDDPFITLSGSKDAPVLDLGGEALELEEEDEIQLEVPRKAQSARGGATALAAAKTPVAAPIEGDPDQLLAEASVYLRYGKRAQAIASLRAILDQDPNHRAALERLGDAYVDDGQPGEAVGVWLRAAEQIRACGDVRALAVLRDRIATLDPEAAASLGTQATEPRTPRPKAEPRAIESPESEPAADLDLDLEVELDAAADELGAEAGDVASDAPGIEIDLEAEGLDLANADDEPSADEGAEDAPGESLSLADDGSFEIELDPNEISNQDGEEVEASSSVRHGTTTTTARIQEELEEAEFYIAQAMFDEAEAILGRILELAPNHPSAMLRMGEIQVARGATPDTPAKNPEPKTRAGRAVAGTAAGDLGTTARFDDAVDLDPAEDEVSGGDSSGDVSAEFDLGEEDGERFELGSAASAGDSAADDALRIEIDLSAAESEEAFADVAGGFGEADDLLDEGDEDLAAPQSASGAVAVAAGDDGDDDADEVSDARAVSVTPSRVAVQQSPASDTAAVSLPAAPSPERAATIVLPRPALVPPTITAAPPVAPQSPVSPTPVPAPAPGVAAAVQSVPVVEMPAAPADEKASNRMAAQPAVAVAQDVPAAELGDSFDLREALADVFNDPGDSARGRIGGAVPSTVDDGFESIFSDFKKGVSATLGEGDYDTRYDLGIAYREMGLFEDAIGEFKICLESPARRFESLHLMGLCARDLGRHGDAVHHFEQALALPDLPTDRLAGVYFDLALAQAQAGDRDRARANLRRVVEIDPRFPNAAERLAELDAAPAMKADGDAERGAGAASGAFESFDDLFSEDASEDTAPAEESFESFDDVVSDARSAIAEPAELSPTPEPTPEPASPPPSVAPAADTNEKSARKGPRKKISFV